MKLTHLAVSVEGRFRTLCGRPLDDWNELARSGDATCSTCKRLDEEDEAALKQLQEMPEGPGLAFRSPFDPLGIPKRRRH